MKLDTDSTEMLQQLAEQDLTTIEIKNRINLDDNGKISYRLQDKLAENDLIEEVERVTPDHGGADTTRWHITEKGEQMLEDQDVEVGISLEDIRERVKDLEDDITRLDNKIDHNSDRIDNRATYDKVNRSIDHMEDDIQTLKETVEFMEGRAREAGKSKARAKVAELKENILEERLKEFQEDNIRDLIDDIQAVSRANSDLRSTNERLRDDMNRRDDKIKKLEERIDELEARDDGNEGLFDKLF